MDFALTDEQQEVAGLATKIFGGKHADADALWSTLAGSGLIGTAVSDDVGGAGHGVLEWCALLTAAGQAGAAVPLWAVTTGALAVDRFGTPAQRRAILPRVIAGEAVITVGFDGDDRIRTCVPAADRATWIVVPRGDGLGVVEAARTRVERQLGTTGESLGLVTLGDAPVEPLGDDAAWLVERATVGLCALELGVCDQVVRMTAQYTAQRVQFDRPIATFQAVAQRAADAFIDVETIRLTLWEAAWRLSQGLPASREVAIAKFFAADAGQRVTYAAQHLHGGIGFDLDYPLARYYPLSKQIELALGGATAQLARLGQLLASG
jgi:3-oxocholest-4-en-26-oyl-CoA dehydrogenase beta subunit